LATEELRKTSPHAASWEPRVPQQPEEQPEEHSSSVSRSETPRRLPPLPCCRNWALCGRSCAYSATPLRLLHDEDGATVHAVCTSQFPYPVVYKRYELDGSAALAALVREEQALLRQLGGRGRTIPLLDAFLDAAGDPVLVFPLCHDDTPSRPSSCRAYARQLLQALAFLASQRVMHRNVKRANVLWSEVEHELRLIDFEGSARVEEGALLPRWGNNAYRAPEVAAAKPPGSPRAPPPAYVCNPLDNTLSPAAPVGCRADVFSAGLCIAELLLGVRRMLDVERLPASYAELEAALAEASRLREPRAAFEPQLERMQAGRAAAARARLSRDAADLLTRLLAWDPAERLDAEEALSHPYFAVTEAAAAAEDARYEAAEAAEAARASRKRRRERREERWVA